MEHVAITSTPIFPLRPEADPSNPRCQRTDKRLRPKGHNASDDSERPRRGFERSPDPRLILEKVKKVKLGAFFH